MHRTHSPRWLLLCSLAGLAVLGGGWTATAIAAGKANVALTVVYSVPFPKDVKQQMATRLSKDFSGDGRKVSYHERDKSASKDSSDSAIPVSESETKVEDFILVATAIDNNGDHKPDHYQLEIYEDKDHDDNPDADEEFDKEQADDEAGLLDDVDTIENKIDALMSSRDE